MAVWVSRNPKLLDSVARFVAGIDAALVPWDRAQFNGELDSALHNRLRREYVPPDEWYIICDLDEFHVVPGFATFGDAATAATRDGCNAVCGVLIDRITADGSIPTALHDGKALGSQFPIGSHLTAAIGGGCAIKVQMAHASVAIEPGHHVCQGKPWNIWGEVHHFKWWGTVIDEQKTRLESYRLQSVPYSGESAKLIGYFAEHSGRIPLDDPRIVCFRIANDPVDRPAIGDSGK